jgi:hypothetical protein
VQVRCSSCLVCSGPHTVSFFAITPELMTREQRAAFLIVGVEVGIDGCLKTDAPMGLHHAHCYNVTLANSRSVAT